MRADPLVPVRAGALYFALVFAAGFVLGAFRTLWLAPRVGDFAAVAVELPVMLAVAWLACGAVLRWVNPGQGIEARAIMGLFAFALLMIAELALALTFGVPSVAAWLADLVTAPGLLGLAGQIAFANFPLVRQRPASI
ncbi:MULTISPECIES: hypothetical protein [Hyphobacterium]|uniref:DUF4345 domain-containing protein n=1 Tax=Hyphobacterium vulgare TaxID=1736751 RepID=A0ABV7A0G8_9PROT